MRESSRSRGAVVMLSGLALLACTAEKMGERGAPDSSAVVAAAAELILDTRPDGASLGADPLPVVPNSDADRVVILRLTGVEHAIAGSLEGSRAIDARFVDEGVVVLGTDRVLRFYGMGGAIELDERVYGPLSVAGASVAYVRGGPPDLELARVDVRTGVVEQVTRGMAPAWSPALSEDGRELLFVSGVGGSPRLYHVDPAGTLEALVVTERVPSAPTAPRWAGETLIFEDELGVAVLDVDRGAVVHEVPGARGLAVLKDGALAASIANAPITRLALREGVR